MPAAPSAAAAASVVRDPVEDDAGMPEGAVGLGAAAAPAAVLACLCTAAGVVAEELLAVNGPAPAAVPSVPAPASTGAVTMRMLSPSAAAVVTAMGAMPPWCFSTSTLMCFKAPGNSNHSGESSTVSANAQPSA